MLSTSKLGNILRYPKYLLLTVISRECRLTTIQDHSTSADNPRHALLHDSKIEEWLAQKGTYSMPTPSNPDSKLEGGIRLVISEREYYQPPSFSMSKQSYLKIEEEFRLPEATLHALTNKSGIFSRYVEYDEKIPGKLKRIGIYILMLMIDTIN
jgi:hypothetical protein